MRGKEAAKNRNKYPLQGKINIIFREIVKLMEIKVHLTKVRSGACASKNKEWHDLEDSSLNTSLLIHNPWVKDASQGKFFCMMNLIITYQEKYSIFECGFHSFLGQNRTQFGVKFFIFALVYLLLDLEILVIYPFGLSGYENGIYGLIIVLIFIGIITAGFVFELGKNALKIDSRQSYSYYGKSKLFVNTFIENK